MTESSLLHIGEVFFADSEIISITSPGSKKDTELYVMLVSKLIFSLIISNVDIKYFFNN